jgi:Bacterial Ig-like domain (group 3)/Matrixin/Right handed beta helix region
MSLRLSPVRRSTSRARQYVRARRNRRHWAFEGLEGRVLLSGNPTYYTVNLTSDTGAESGTDVYPTAGTPSGDLLWAVTQANTNSNTAGSVIEFDPTVFATPQTITLASTLVLSESAGPEVIDGPGGNLVTISGGETNDTSGDALFNGVGVFQVDSGVEANLSGLTITEGYATNGGGINNGGTLTVADSTIEHSSASNDGGGINNTGTLTVTDSTIENSRANNGGGGIDNSGSLTVADSTVAGNGAGNGGGIDNSGSLTVADSTVAGNGSGNGGGIDNLGTLTAVNATIAYNFNGGGGLNDETGSTTILDNTIVALNTNGNYAPDDITGVPVSSASTYNLIGTGGSGGLVDQSTDPAPHNQVGVANPGLAADSANNGGPTQNIALLPGSPAIGAGSVALADEYSLTTDQRGAGFSRIVNGTVDIGAFESPVFGTPTHYTVNVATDNDPTSGGSGSGTIGDLRYCITQANANTNSAGSLITFDSTVFNETITLTSTLELSEAPWPEVIQGPYANVVTISGNNAVQVFVVGGATTATLSDLTISRGFADGADANIDASFRGAGIDNFGSLIVTGCTIADNADSAGLFGGSIVNEGGPFPVLTVTDSTIEGNSDGGILNMNMATVTDSTIVDNSGGYGGIYSFGFLTVTNCTIADEVNGNGANGNGVFIQGGPVILTNSTITENSGDGFDANISDSSTYMRINDCTITHNSSGGIAVSAGVLTLTLDNSMVALNTDSGAADLQVEDPSSLVANNNLVGVDGTGTQTGVDGNIVGVDPLLGPLANNGGPTETIALLPGSPAIGAGSVALAVDANGNPLTTDQRGEPRIVDGNVDIGAFEGQVENTTTSVTASPNTSVSGQSVTFTATVAAPAGSAIPIPTGLIQFEIDGSDFGSPVALVDGSATSSAISSLSVTSHTISAVYTPSSADFIANTGSTSVSVEPATESNIQSVVNISPSSSGGSVTLQTTSDAAVTTAVQAVNAATPHGSVTVTLDLGGGTYTTDTQVNTQPGVTLVIENGTLVGGSPALVVNSGDVVLDHVTALNSTNAPTIVVNGGNLIVRDSTIQESAGFNQAAILIAGGSVDLGAAASPGGNIFNVNGAGQFLEDTTSSPVPDVGNTLQVNGSPIPAHDLSLAALSSSASASVFGQPVTFTAVVRAANPTDGTPDGTVTFYDGSTALGTGTLNLSGLAAYTTSAFQLSIGGQPITAVYSGDANFATSTSAVLSQTVSKDSTTTAVSSSANSSNFGQTLTFTASATANAPGSGTPTGSVDFFDSTTNTDLTPGNLLLSSGTATFAIGSLPVGSHTIAVSYGGDGNFQSSAGTRTITVKPSILVLDPTAAGALTLSGNASIALTSVSGSVFVDSSSTAAISASGNASVTASSIKVVGKVQKSGNASFSPAPTTGVAALPDPLASLPSPGTTGVTNHGSESLSGNSSATINPGIYSQISVSGNAKLTLNTGTYIIEGGGFTVSGNASVTGWGVTIYNAGGNYPNSGGNFGGITLSGNGTFSMTAPITGTYAGILIFQSRQNTRALSFSGNAMLGMTGTIYAASALLSMSGNSQLQNPLVVDMLNLSGNVGLTQTAAGSDGTSDTSGLANTLLAGNLSVYINDPNGNFSADELARIQDAINAWDAILAPYNVTIAEVSDPSLANVVIDTGNTSAAGGASNGVLGCYDGATGEITLIQNWNWYAGEGPSQIGAGQYDFETTVTHELGHALGLGHSADPSSPMYATLATGVADRIPSTQDLNIPDPPDGADPQIAAEFNLGAPNSSLSRIAFAALPGAVPAPGPVGVMPLAAAGIMGTSFLTGFAPHLNPLESSAAPVNQPEVIAQTALRLSLAVQELDNERGDRVLPLTGMVPDSDVDDLAMSALVTGIQNVAGPVAIGTVSAAGLNRSQATQGTSSLKDFRRAPVFYGCLPRQEANPQFAAPDARLTDMLLAAGFCSFGAATLAARCQRMDGLYQKQKALKINPRRK